MNNIVELSEKEIVSISGGANLYTVLFGVIVGFVGFSLLANMAKNMVHTFGFRTREEKILDCVEACMSSYIENKVEGEKTIVK
ncbi:hypothetical protein GAMM_40191 [Gammaproteobacteria bacterium]